MTLLDIDFVGGERRDIPIRANRSETSGAGDEREKALPIINLIIYLAVAVRLKSAQ